MFPGGMNPKALEQAMKKMGVNQVEIDATSVVIRCKDKDIIIDNPSVSKVNMMGQTTFQIVGDAKEVKRVEEEVIEVTEDDIKTVMDQTGVDEDTAFSYIEKSGGDLAEAIMMINESKEKKK